jgi:hypothetical protein
MFGRNRGVNNESTATMSDPTGWLIESGLSEILLLSTPAIKYMAMIGYTYMHGKIFIHRPPS